MRLNRQSIYHKGRVFLSLERTKRFSLKQKLIIQNEVQTQVSGLFVGERAILDVVGVIGQVNLGAMVNAVADFTLFFFSESFEKGRGFPFSSAANWQF